MKQLLLLLTLPLLACQPADKTSEKNSEDVSVSQAENKLDQPTQPLKREESISKDGQVRLVLQTPVSEPRACILPIRVENGLEASVSVTMIGFSVTGPGDDTRGNMFAPIAGSGAVSEARVILEGQSCDAYDQVTASEVVCRSNDTDCSDLVQLKEGGGLRFITP